MSTRSFIGAIIAAMLLTLLPAGLAVGSEGASPFVGAWESFDPEPDGSHVRLQIAASGEWRLRDVGVPSCESMPGSAAGEATFDGDEVTFGAFDLYCYPRDGRGRYLRGTYDFGFMAEYIADSGVMVDNLGVCWWRSGTGSFEDCPPI